MKKDITNKVRAFVNKWKNKGNEKQDTHPFWEELAECLLGVEHGRDCFDWEKKVPPRAIVVEEGGENPKYIDCYLKPSRCVIEQKSYNISLDTPHARGNNKDSLTALQQAQWYYDNMDRPEEGKGRYTISCNFQEFRIFDNNHGDKQPEPLRLEDLPHRWPYLRRVLMGGETFNNDNAQDIAAKTASGFVSRLYDLLQKQYTKDELTKDVLHHLNVFCVRVVFCLYADDEEIFDDNQFHTFLNAFSAKQLNNKFKWLFTALDKAKRPESFDPEILAFPRVNGGLFKNDVPIPRISEEVKALLLKASEGSQMKGKDYFDWSEISPTNFGCIFESTLDPTTREENGMHYTSPENIHRLIDPLFLNDLNAELDTLLHLPHEKEKEKEKRFEALKNFQNKIAKLQFLDPACGSGNFLTETFKSLRRLEMKLIAELPNCGLGEDAIKENGVYLKNPCKVNIRQFYGIEINDFATQVANTALWISDCQMIAEAEELFSVSIPALPLKQNDNIRCANALETNWEDVVNPRNLNYIIGNPPFKGARGGKDTKEDKEKRKAEMKAVLTDKDAKGKIVWESIGNLDYVCAWYAKAAQFMQKASSVKAALVSTNSIIQGEQAILLWKPLMTHFNVKISFAWHSFVWNNQAKKKAQVHCVIIGFYSSKRKKKGDCFIYEERKPTQTCNCINNYLRPFENYFINTGLKKPLCSIPTIGIGNKPIDGGAYLFTEKQKNDFIAKEPESALYFHKWYGSIEFTSGIPRYCLWLGDCEPNALDKMPQCKKVVEAVRKYRLLSDSKQTRKLALKPTRFHVENMPKGDYLVIPETSSKRRRYVPFGYMTHDILCSNAVRLMPNVTPYHFGIMESSIHMAWMRVVCGRMKSDYRYSIEIVYNNFPWPSHVTDEQRKAIEEKANNIINVRANYKNSTLKQLYAPQTMPSDLMDAHIANDKAVFAVYSYLGIKSDMTDEEIAMKLLHESVRLAKLKDRKKPSKKKKTKKVKK
jgi:type I restriction-modification system DNA methylase subunit